MTLTIQSLHQQLEAKGCGQGQELRRHTLQSHGHQGDIYVHPVAYKPDCWDVENTDNSRQIAIGQGVGSHHTAEGNVRVFWPRNIDEASEEVLKIFPLFFKDEAEARKQCIGPIVVAKETWLNPHPTHAHHEFPAGIYFVSYQLDRATMRRVVD
jgi:hypothetical protein